MWTIISLVPRYLYVGGSFGAPTYHIIPTYMVPLIHRFFPMVRFKSTSTCSLEHPDICREEWIDTYISYQSKGDATALLAFFFFSLYFFLPGKIPNFSIKLTSCLFLFFWWLQSRPNSLKLLCLCWIMIVQWRLNSIIHVQKSTFHCLAAYVGT